MSGHLCLPGMKPAGSQCMISLMMCCIQFANILLRILTSMFIRETGLQFSFSVESLSGFGIRIIILASGNESGSVASLSNPRKSLRSIYISSSLNF